MASPLPSSGTISMQTLNNYLGANSTTQLSLSGVGSGATYPSVNTYSLNQIFYSPAGGDIPLSTLTTMAGLHGKTFGIFSNSNRTLMHMGHWSDPLAGSFVGYFGFGSSNNGISGILNPVNLGFNIGITVAVIFGANFDINLSFEVYTSSGFWQSILMKSTTTTIYGNYSAMRLTAQPGSDFQLVVQVWPSKEGLPTSDGLHTMSLELAQEGGGDPGDGPDGPGGEISEPIP